MPSLYINIDVNDGAPAVAAAAGDPPPVPPTERYRIIRIEAKGGKRVAGAVKIAVTGKMKTDERFVAATATAMTGGWVKLTPTDPLTPGEYAIAEMLGKEGINLYVWDFGCEPIRAGECRHLETRVRNRAENGQTPGVAKERETVGKRPPRKVGISVGRRKPHLIYDGAIARFGVQEVKEGFVLDRDQVGVVHAVRGFEIFHGFVFVAGEGNGRGDRLRLEVLLAGERLDVFHAPTLDGGLSAGYPSPLVLELYGPPGSSHGGRRCRYAIIQNPKGDDRAYLNAAWWFSVVRGIALYTIAFAAAPFVARFYGNPELTALVRVTA